MFEDDVILHPDWRRKVEQITLPRDWGLFYLGCQHVERPTVVSPGLVKVTNALDTHAFGIRRKYFREVMRAFTGMPRALMGTVPPSDFILTQLQKTIPTYAAFPNLAWQSVSHSDLADGAYSNYHSDGTQKNRPGVMAGLEWEMANPVMPHSNRTPKRISRVGSMPHGGGHRDCARVCG